MRYYDGNEPAPEKRPEIEEHLAGENPAVFDVEPDIRILEQGKSAIMIPKRLPGLGLLRKKKFAGYVFFLLTLVSIIIYVIPMAAAIIGFDGFGTLFRDKLPDIKVENGILQCEERFEMAIPNLHIIIDTEEAVCNLPDTDAGGMYLLLGSKEFRLTLLEVAGNQKATQNLMDGKIGDFLPDGMVKEDLVSIIPGIYITLFLAWILVIVGLMIRYFFMALVYMLFAFPMIKRSGLPLEGGEIFRMCFYAETTGILLVNINTATGLIPGGIASIAGIILTCVYIFRSVKEYTRPAGED